MKPLLNWTFVVPIAALAVLGATLGRDIGTPLQILVGLTLAAAIVAAVHHAEIIAHRVGEPYASLVLAVAVTIIEVALILTLMSGGGSKAPTLARDTVFAAVMITANGIAGASILLAALRRGRARFNPEGTGGALATVITLATLSLVLPTFTTSAPGPEFTPAQLAFAAAASLALYALFVVVQTKRHRGDFMPITSEGEVIETEEHAEVPSRAAAWRSLGLLLVSLVAVVGLAKILTPAIESAVAYARLPASFVGVVIAILVLGPETVAAIRAAARDRVQTSLNLAFGSAMASIGLTIPAIAVASIWIDQPLHLGLGSVQMVLLALTAIVGILTVVPGRATRLQGGIHLVLFAAFVFLAATP